MKTALMDFLIDHAKVFGALPMEFEYRDRVKRKHGSCFRQSSTRQTDPLKRSFGKCVLTNETVRTFEPD